MMESQETSAEQFEEQNLQDRERQSLDEATNDPRSQIEQTADYQQAEAIQSALESILEATSDRGESGANPLPNPLEAIKDHTADLTDPRTAQNTQHSLSDQPAESGTTEGMLVTAKANQEITQATNAVTKSVEKAEKTKKKLQQAMKDNA